MAPGIGIEADNGPTRESPRGIKIFNGTVRGMGSNGITMTGEGGTWKKWTADSNCGFGFLLAGSVIQSAATGNGNSGIFAITVRDCNATDNHKDGIVLDASGGVGIGNISSFNGGNGSLTQPEILR